MSDKKQYSSNLNKGQSKTNQKKSKKSLIDKIREIDKKRSDLTLDKDNILTIYGLVFTILGLWLAYYYESYSFIIPAVPINAFCSYFIFNKKRNWKGIFWYSGTFLVTAILLWLVMPRTIFEQGGLLLLSMEMLTILLTAIGTILGIVLSSKVQKIQESKNKKKVRKTPNFEKEKNKERDGVDEREKVKKNKSECDRRRVSGDYESL